MKIARTNHFKDAWQQLDEDQKKQARKAIRNLALDVRYPALRVKKIRGTEHIWEARVSREIRLTFHVQGDTVILRNIGHHDETLDRP
jgi:mRNA-degrading endonuclease RelE of RelBE toxin-antitoxin system